MSAGPVFFCVRSNDAIISSIRRSKFGTKSSFALWSDMNSSRPIFGRFGYDRKSEFSRFDTAVIFDLVCFSLH